MKGRVSIIRECVDLPGDHVPPAGAVGTGGALVRLLPRVSPLVGGEMVRPAEDLQT